MYRKTLIVGIALFILTALSGCIVAAAGVGAEAGYVASQEDRTTGQVIDDQLIVTSIKAKMLANSKVSGMNINVDSHQGIVTLRGYVRSVEELQTALEIAEKTSGVLQVNSMLSLQP